MADVQGILLNAGKEAFTSALTGFSVVGPHSFQCGSSFGFAPDATDIAPRGTVVYTGSALMIQARQLAPDTARYTITIPEGEGPFNIGNIVLYVSTLDNNAIPFASVVLPFSYEKKVSLPTYGSSNPLPTPGSRFVVNITIKHSLDSSTINISVITPTFSSLGFYEDIATVPSAAVNPWKTFVVHTDPRTDSPAFIATRRDNTYWGMPLWQNFRNPKFGVIDGGNTGDNYQPPSGSFIWGNYYLTPDSKYSGKIGGSSYKMLPSQYVASVGGMPY